MSEQHILDADPKRVANFLRERDWIDADSHVTAVTRAGEGNMNLVLRVSLVGGTADSVILKQARPWVEKFPEIEAPVERMEVETAFYRLAAREPALVRRMPQLLAADPEQHAALFEDLGEARDYTACYGSRVITRDEAAALLDWLGHLHALEVDAAQWPELANRSMRALNRIHIFDLPLDPDTGPDADEFCPGLGRIAQTLRADTALARRMQELAAEYERDGSTLLQGDYYPGSWLETAQGPAIIDPEFGHLGAAEFDLGVFQAHLHFTGSAIDTLNGYAPTGSFDTRLSDAFAGAELIRRLLGVAQLPIAADLAQRERWLELGRELVLS